MCQAHAGPFNLLQASLTSLQALEALQTQTLHYSELLCNITQPTTSLEGDDEPAYADTFDDPSDIPVDVIKQHVMSGIVTGGFLIDNDGCLSILLLLRS